MLNDMLLGRELASPLIHPSDVILEVLFRLDSPHGPKSYETEVPIRLKSPVRGNGPKISDSAVGSWEARIVLIIEALLTIMYGRKERESVMQQACSILEIEISIVGRKICNQVSRMIHP